jgi:hypothetical protein
MANYFNIGISDAPFKADEDLTAWQHKLVKASSTVGNVERFQHATVGSTCPLPIGILTNDPSAGQEASVAVIGFTKAKARVSVCVLRYGAWLMSASDGFLEPASAVDGTAESIARWFGPESTTADASLLGNALVFILPACVGVRHNFS